MTEFHSLRCSAHPGGLLLECEDDRCGRRLVIDRDRGDLTVIDRGDPYALHRGSIGDVELRQPRINES
jgi:hypothetical protein